jgi:hypothetical protein
MPSAIQGFTVRAQVIIAGAATAILLTQTNAIQAQTGEPGYPPAIVVRTYDYFGGPLGDLRMAYIEADTILRQAGLGVTWLGCRVANEEPRDIPPRCQATLTTNEVVLKIKASNEPTDTSQVGLGVSIVDRATGTGAFSTVYIDRIVRLARSAGVDTQLVLGRAIAHEIGHLLLGTSRHPSAGLMRALWSHTELQRNRVYDWRFLDEEAEAMKAAVVIRSVPIRSNQARLD